MFHTPRDSACINYIQELSNPWHVNATLCLFGVGFYPYVHVYGTSFISSGSAFAYTAQSHPKPKEYGDPVPTPNEYVQLNFKDMLLIF